MMYLFLFNEPLLTSVLWNHFVFLLPQSTGTATVLYFGVHVPFSNIRTSTSTSTIPKFQYLGESRFFSLVNEKTQY
jgi:hypothetical protein